MSPRRPKPPTEAPDVGITAEFEAQPKHLDEVRARLHAIQKTRGGRVRWQITKHTAELAIRGIQAGARRKHEPGSKSRRRRGRRKRLL